MVASTITKIMAFRPVSTVLLALTSMIRQPVTGSLADAGSDSDHVPSLLDTSITELAMLLDTGRLTSHDLTQLYIDRIVEVNDEFHAVIEINPCALAIATELDRQRAAGLAKGHLFGIPILVKDNYGTTDSMLTGAGSVCLAPAPATVEATVVTRLRNAGAIILGKTNADEFSGARGINVTGGWSARGGQTFGAYVEHQSPCGSSGGSGVAASLGLAAAALGTETAGSITCPAAYNNVVGIKPTVGTTSRYGVVPVTLRQDTTGPLAPNIADAALILDVMAGVDPLDNYTLAQPWDGPPSFMAALHTSALHGKRLGVVWLDFNPLSPSDWVNKNETKTVFDASRQYLEAAGAVLVDVPLSSSSVPLGSLISWVRGNMSIYETPDLRDGLQAYIDTIPADIGTVHSLETLIGCIESDPRERATTYSYESLVAAAESDVSAGSEEVWEAHLAASGLTRSLVVELIEDNDVDALVLLSDLALVLGAAAGLPIVTVPMGSLGADSQTEWDSTNTTIQSAPGIPLGLSFLGDRWSDVELVSYGYAYEQVSQKRSLLKPYLQPRSDLASVLGHA
ncbi:amidase signature domain-containing protein [Microdochium trichocladiopsis]|uniref:Amidase signature domain-containing protein n=1 Tax=Microdochium trichocladiopsis TaxID=1682393 RepID=A0A9P8YF19_9PEZI|nr:amidase signature domain-containing protein [Microdochium trichocladiopsis]KAH7035771.1 amidase signature domain-containing protein [Microdochium trichocladiopsis]